MAIVDELDDCVASGIAPLLVVEECLEHVRKHALVEQEHVALDRVVLREPVLDERVRVLLPQLGCDELADDERQLLVQDHRLEHELVALLARVHVRLQVELLQELVLLHPRVVTHHAEVEGAQLLAVAVGLERVDRSGCVAQRGALRVVGHHAARANWLARHWRLRRRRRVLGRCVRVGGNGLRSSRVVAFEVTSCNRRATKFSRLARCYTMS